MDHDKQVDRNGVPKGGFSPNHHDYADILQYLAKYQIDEDIAQEAVLRLSQTTKKVRHPRTWCYQKCKWLLADRSRRAKYRTERTQVFMGDPTQRVLTESPLRRLELRDRIRRGAAGLDEAIARKKQRAELREDIQVVLGE